MTDQAVPEYLVQFRGAFKSAMRWHDLDDLWQVLRASPKGWYVYHVGDEVPHAPLDEAQFENFLEQVDRLLRADHQEDYCGIVYADDLRVPSMVKIYDPHNLGVSCGYSESPPLPGWVVSRAAPVDLEPERILPANRKRWWRRLFS